MDEEKWQFCCRLLLSSHYTLIRNFKGKSRSNSILRPFTVNYTRPFLIHFAEQLLSDSDGVKSQVLLANAAAALPVSPHGHLLQVKMGSNKLWNKDSKIQIALWVDLCAWVLPSLERQAGNWGWMIYIECIVSSRAPQQVRCHCLPLIGSWALFSKLPASSLLCNGKRRFKTQGNSSWTRVSSLPLPLAPSCSRQCWACW